MKLEKVTDQEKAPQKRWYDDACGTALALEFIGERWSLLIMRELMMGARRFGEIRANLPGISANVLTQRLEGLEGAGIVVRRKLPSHASVQVYELTAWGLEAEPILQEMGRWATRSNSHNPTLNFSPTSAMLSLRTMIDDAKAGDMALTIAFRFPTDSFVGRLAEGELSIERGEMRDADVTFIGDTPVLAGTFYGKQPFEENEANGRLTIEGDRAVLQGFVDLFHLPEKIAP